MHCFELCIWSWKMALMLMESTHGFPRTALTVHHAPVGAWAIVLKSEKERIRTGSNIERNGFISLIRIFNSPLQHCIGCFCYKSVPLQFLRSKFGTVNVGVVRSPSRNPILVC